MLLEISLGDCLKIYPLEHLNKMNWIVQEKRLIIHIMLWQYITTRNMKGMFHNFLLHPILSFIPHNTIFIMTPLNHSKIKHIYLSIYYLSCDGDEHTQLAWLGT